MFLLSGTGVHHPIRKNGILHKRINTRTMVVVFVLWHWHIAVGPTSNYGTNKKTTKNLIVSLAISLSCCLTSKKAKSKTMFSMLGTDGAVVIQNNTQQRSTLATSDSIHWIRIRNHALAKYCGFEV